MKKLLLIMSALALPLGGCQALQTGTLPAPATYAKLTKADEQAINTAEQGYKGFRLLSEIGVNAHLIHGPRAESLRQLDDKLYAGLRAMELAYETGNASSFAAAQNDFNQFLTQANALAGGKD